MFNDYVPPWPSAVAGPGAMREEVLDEPCQSGRLAIDDLQEFASLAGRQLVFHVQHGRREPGYGRERGAQLMARHRQEAALELVSAHELEVGQLHEPGMGLTYMDQLDAISPDMLDGGFFDGWPNPPSPERHLDLLHGSYRTVLATDDETGKVVGFVNAVGDGVLTAYIPLLEVLPPYRGRGLATELMRRMFEGLALYMVDLACDDDLVPFYERLGMQRGNSMNTRDYALQSGAPA